MTPRAPLACATALAALFTVALAQQLCETTQFGNESQIRMSRPVRRVEPGMFTLEINDPDVCRDSEPVGLMVTACDAGQAPRVLLLDAARGMVVRAGSLAGAAQVYSTVYCAEPSDVAPDLQETPTTDTSILTTTTSASPLLSLSTPDSLLLSEVEPPSILALTDEYLPPVRLESRFSSIGQSNGSPISSRLSRIKDLWKDRDAPSLDQLKSQSFPESTSSKLQKNDQSLLDKPEHQPSIYDSYLTHIYGLPKSSASVAKRLIDLRPKKANKWLENRAPSWKRRPTRRPSSPWLKLRSQLDVETRKSTSRSRNRALNAFTDYNDPWTPYEDEPLSLHWSDEPIDSNPWYTEGNPQSPYTNNFPWRIKPPKGNNWDEEPHLPVYHERPSQSSIKHDSKKQSRLVPPIHKEDPDLLLEWNEDRPRSKRPALPKLLLLMHDQEHQAPAQRQCSSHSVEDTEPWWSNQPYKNIENEGIPWQADYPADYTADDGDARSYSPGNYIDDRILTPHVKEREPTQPPRHHATPPARILDAQLFPHASQKTPASTKASPFENYFYYSPTPLTERPLLTSTVRNSLPWIKSSNAKPLKLPMKPKKSNSKKLLEKSNHHPPNHNYPSDHRYPSRPMVPAGTNYRPKAHNPPNLPYPSRPNYPPETYNPSYLQSNTFSEAENDFPSKPHLPSGPHYSLDTDLELNPFSEVESNPPEPYYPSESGNIPSEPYYLSESGNVPSVPIFPSELDYLSEHHYPSEPSFPSELDYSSEANYPGTQFPSEPEDPSEYLASSAPWKFLSKLLLSHPSFRDSTHVIRIR